MSDLIVQTAGRYITIRISEENRQTTILTLVPTDTTIDTRFIVEEIDRVIGALRAARHKEIVNVYRI